MSQHVIRCKKSGRAIANKLDGGQCVCASADQCAMDATEVLLPCPFCGGEARMEEVEGGVRGVVFSVGCNSNDEAECMGYQSLTTYSRRSDAAKAWNKRAPMGGQVGAHADQHPRWEPGDRSSRHPQTPAEWDYRNDPAGAGLDRSVRRLNVAGDYDDPRAPDQMALVLRIDVIRLMHDWIHKNAAWEAWRERRGAAEALRAVRRELWVDYCLGMSRTDCDPAPFNARPHIRIIDEALGPPENKTMPLPSPLTLSPTFEDAWQAFVHAHQRVMDEHSGTEPTKARQAGVRAIVDLLNPGAL